MSRWIQKIKLKTDLNVAFRVDASHKIGIGHVMRCITLANALKKNGAHTRFICRHLPKSLHELFSSQGHELVLLNHSAVNVPVEKLAHSNLLETSQAQDAIDSLKALSDKAWDWLVIDHYAIDAKYEKKLRSAAKKIFVIDDIADRFHNCDVLLDQNLYSNMESRYTEKLPKYCQVLLGPKYALLREEFRQLREHVKPRIGPVGRILIFFGGIDPENLTSRTIEAIKNINTNIIVDVVIGTEHPYRIEIEKSCKINNYNFYVQTKRMAELMAASDLAIGAGGSASWERCCLGLATVSIAFADNQYDIANSLDNVGACIFIGDQESATQKKIESTLELVINDSNLLLSISEKAFSLADGCGAERVCKILN